MILAFFEWFERSKTALSSFHFWTLFTLNKTLRVLYFLLRNDWISALIIWTKHWQCYVKFTAFNIHYYWLIFYYFYPIFISFSIFPFTNICFITDEKFAFSMLHSLKPSTYVYFSISPLIFALTMKLVIL